MGFQIKRIVQTKKWNFKRNSNPNQIKFVYISNRNTIIFSKSERKTNQVKSDFYKSIMNPI